MAEVKKRLIIIDGTSVAYRAFHAIPKEFKNSKGVPTNAVYGFTQTFKKIIALSPDYMAVAFDVKGPTFRHGMYEGYKKERPLMPDSLSMQLPYIKKIIKAFNVAVLESRSFEADDIIATIARAASKTGLKTAIITGDKDMCQLVDENTVIFDYVNNREFGEEGVEERLGVAPSSVRDLLGLAGDPTDNIPGVPGIGSKTAVRLLKDYGSIEGVYENLGRIKNEKVQGALKNHRDQAMLSRDLATLHDTVPFEWSIEGLEYRGANLKELTGLFKELEFGKLLKEFSENGPDAGAAKTGFKTIETDGELSSLLAEARAKGILAIAIEQFGKGPMEGVISAGIALSEENVYCIAGNLSAKPFLKASLSDSRIKKHTDNSKLLHSYALQNGFELAGVSIDTSLASYVLNPSFSGHTIEDLALRHYGAVIAQAQTSARVFEAGNGAPGVLYERLCQKALNIYMIAELFHKQLESERLYKLYSEIELPLAGVLAAMELKGIKVDILLLKNLSKEIDIELGSIEERIYSSAGFEFNINSPKQLAQALFERLKLKPVKRTKTGFSTDEEVLTRLAPGHEVPAMILSYRQMSKLKATYIDALVSLTDPATSRIHTSFNQTVTATGRLSSSRPNLQNIPVRGQWAVRIREAFVPENGCIFVSADYSQIELRILAHMSKDPVLLGSFLRGEDIHSRTAEELFGVPRDGVTPELRRKAKAINFGIVYGMGPYGLSTELGISMDEASEYIERYFLHYKSVKGFIGRTIEEAGEMGYTETIFGRRRYIPELSSANEATVRFGQRMAVNTPIQGTSADIIKLAMIRIHERLKTARLESRMLLQIHDELIFEALLEEKEPLCGLIREEMEGVVSLALPLKVNIKTGDNWAVVE
ncbi:MAG: DNA polymerase I [Deltaproteobacteria bacterium]|nr:DNA polymerase I [Deltaproteobacteria bacterium]